MLQADQLPEDAKDCAGNHRGRDAGDFSPLCEVPVTRRIAELSRRVRFADLPSAVIERAKQCFLDWLGVALAGSVEPAARIVREVVALEALPPPLPAATLLGTGLQAGPLSAALANGTAAHALDYDDVATATGTGHPSAPVFPALLALAELDDASGKDFVAAAVAGHEAEGRVSLLISPDHYATGWHTTATAGTFGAAAACAHLRRFDLDTWQMAFGIAGTQAAGLKAMFGTMCKPFHAGKAASNGLLAALLAERGFTSNPAVLEAPQGFGWTQARSFFPDRALGPLEGGYAICSVIFKKHAACFGTHSSIEGILALRSEHHFAAEEVRRVVLRVPPGHLAMCNIVQPRTALEAKFSLRFTAAMALGGAETTSQGFVEGIVADPYLSTLSEKVEVEPAGPDEGWATEVEVTLLDGRCLRASVDVSEPAPDSRLADQWDALAAKFRSLAVPVIGDSPAAELLAMARHLEELPSIRSLTSLV